MLCAPSPVKEPHRLRGLVADLEAALASREEQLVEQCRLAAHEEGKLVEHRLKSELSALSDQTCRLQELSRSRQEECEVRAAKLELSEGRLCEAVQLEQGYKELDEQRHARQEQLRQLEAEQRAAADNLRADVRRARKRGAEEADRLKRQGDMEEQECRRLRDCIRSTEEATAARQVLQSCLEASEKRGVGLEDLSAELRASLDRKEARIEAVRDENTAMEKAARRRVQDTGLQTEHFASEQRGEALAEQVAQLRQIDSLGGALGAQLHASGLCVADMEAALLHAQAEVEGAPLPEEAPASWPEECGRLQEQLSSLQGAEASAAAHTSRLDRELHELRASERARGAASASPRSVGAAAAGGHVAAGAGRVGLGRSQAEQDAEGHSSTLVVMEASLREARAALDAKGRRLQMLLGRFGDTGAGADGAAEGATSAAADRRQGDLGRRAAELEALVAALGGKLDESEREVQSLSIDAGRQAAPPPDRQQPSHLRGGRCDDEGEEPPEHRGPARAVGRCTPLRCIRDESRNGRQRGLTPHKERG
mmetsp:Transcript_50807/g.164327  ORF Transcript_50807/g.164327 Transcript_50807/m.164327 type:complete len:540 (-) Transcript_50807:41-1660(-)